MKSLHHLSDEEVVAVVITKQQEAYRELVIRYQARLIRFASIVVGDHDAAIDVVQDAFISAFVHLRSFNRNKKFSSWLYRIVHNTGVNFLRKEKRDRKIAITQVATVASNEDIQQDISRKEIQILVRKKVDQLPVQYREVLVLYYFDELQYGEISDILRIPMGTVGIRLSRAKALLRHTLIKNHL